MDGTKINIEKIYKKREFYAHRIPPRPDVSNYNDIKEYRENICARDFALHEHQAMLSNYINPDTPYRGILIFHGLGTGKCVWKYAKCQINDQHNTIESIWNNYATNICVDKNMNIQNTLEEWAIPSIPLFVDSYDKTQNIIIKKRVKHLFREYINSYIKIVTFTNGSVIGTTFAHKFLCNNGWTNEYNINDYIAMPKHTTVNPQSAMATDTQEIAWTQIKSIQIISYNDYVYDLEIEDTHNYVVENVICHNTCAGIAVAEKFKSMVQKYNTKIYFKINNICRNPKKKNFFFFYFF